jgi:serine O-acetyltransferase
MRIGEDIACVRARDPAARSWPEVLLCYPGLHALIGHRLNHWLWLRGWRLLARMGSQVVRWATGVEIHPGAVIGRRVFIDHGMGVVIGETARVGDDVTLYHGVTLGSVSNGPHKRHPTIEDGTVLGAGAKVLGAITVHKNALIGGNAVVVKDVPSGGTVVGVPGKVIRVRTDAGESGIRCSSGGADEQYFSGLLARLEQVECGMLEIRSRLGILQGADERTRRPVQQSAVSEENVL